MNTITPSFGQKYYIPGNGKNANRFNGARIENLFGDVLNIVRKDSATATFHTGEKNTIVLENPSNSLLDKLKEAKIEFFSEDAFKIFKNMQKK